MWEYWLLYLENNEKTRKEVNKTRFTQPSVNFPTAHRSDFSYKPQESPSILKIAQPTSEDAQRKLEG